MFFPKKDIQSDHWNTKSLDKIPIFCYFSGMVVMNRKKFTTVGFIALGCPKNTVDSERMLAEIAEAGLLITADPDQADVVVINTCGFIEPAKIESIEAIRHSVEQKKRGRVRKVIVAGCLSERLKEDLLQEVTGIDAIVGLNDRDRIAQIIKVVLNQDEPFYTSLTTKPVKILDDRTRLLIGPSHRAYLRISEGCNRRCSFCTIPSIRGPFRSKSIGRVLKEAGQLGRTGVKEVNLIGQDTTYYLKDRKVKAGLVQLLDRLQKIKGLSWIRLMYLYPTGIHNNLLETMAGSKKIVHYLDIPIQHVNDRILKAMRRSDTSLGLNRLMERIHKFLPDVALRTTVIVGFPGETDTEFDQLLDFIRISRFDALGCFPFYPEPGTPAALLPDQIPDTVKQQRVEQVMLTQQVIAFARQKARIGTELTCLIDEVPARGPARGRFYGQAPEIDSLCLIHDRKVKPGQFIRTRVVDTNGYDLVVKPIHGPDQILPDRREPDRPRHPSIG